MAVQAPTARAVPAARGLTGRRRSEAIMAWAFSAPALLLLIVFLLIPFLMAFGLIKNLKSWKVRQRFTIPRCDASYQVIDILMSHFAVRHKCGSHHGTVAAAAIKNQLTVSGYLSKP